MYTYKGYTIPDRADHEWASVMQKFMHDMIDNLNKVVGGAVFATNVTPSGVGIVTNKHYVDGYVIDSCTTTDSSVTIQILAITGYTQLKPIVTINDVTVTNLTASTNEDTWVGSLSLPVPDDGIFTLIHNDGHQTTLSVISDNRSPTIISGHFTGDYPTNQSELKSGDTFSFVVTADMPFTKIYVDAYGAYNATVITVPSATTSHTFTGTIANRGNTTQFFGARLRVQIENQNFSPYFTTNVTSHVDKIDGIYLNNVTPAITIGSISYPNSQQALKNNESATFNLSISNYETFHVSGIGELDLSSVGIGPSSVSRISGSYNVSTNNMTVTAIRTANGTSASLSSIVKIANVAPQITVSDPVSMLSGGSYGTTPQSYTITITANQLLASAPLLQVAGVNKGVFTGTGFSGSGASWSRPVTIADTDTKGEFNWLNPYAVGLSGLSTNVITGDSIYRIAGFVKRTITIPAWPERSAVIGTIVYDVSKLKCSNLSSGNSDSFNWTYKSTTDPEALKYTITNSNTWYNCDVPNSVSNTTGTIQIEIQETA